MNTVTASALRELHRIHQQLTDVRERIERGPKQIRARTANLQNLEGEQKKTKDAITAAKMAADRKQLDLKSGENKVLDLRAKLNSCSTNKEYQALLDQIAAAEMAGSVLADEILESLEKIDDLQRLAGEASKNVDIARAELAKLEQQVREQEGNLKSELARLEGELKIAEAKLPADFLGNYERVVRSKGEDALAQVVDDCCGGCFQQFTSNMLNDLKMGRAIFCRSCGRLMYLPEDALPTGR